MKLSGDLQFKLLVMALALGGTAYFLWKAKNLVSDMVPKVVKDGAEAVGQLGGLALHIAYDPLDAFGVVPASNAWQKTVPWSDAAYDAKNFGRSDSVPVNTNDPVSNNDAGVNYNYF